MSTETILESVWKFISSKCFINRNAIIFSKTLKDIQVNAMGMYHVSSILFFLGLINGITVAGDHSDGKVESVHILL